MRFLRSFNKPSYGVKVLVNGNLIKSKVKGLKNRVSMKQFRQLQQRIQEGQEKEKETASEEKDIIEDNMLEKISQKLDQQENPELTQINLGKILELVKRDYEVNEQTMQVKLKEKKKNQKNKEKHKRKEKNKLKKNQELLLNRIVPYVLLKDDWAGRLKQFKFSTEKQKKNYDFNKMVHENDFAYNGRVNGPKTGFIKKLPRKHSYKEVGLQKSAAFKIRSTKLF